MTTQTGDKPMVTQDVRDLVADLYESRRFGDGDEAEQAAAIRSGLCDHWDEIQRVARHRENETLSREQSRDVGREALAARLLKNAEWRDDRYQCVTDPNLLKEAAEALTSRPDSVMASIVVKLSAIRNVLREAHFALDDSEDLSHQDPPVHAVPLDNVMRLHRALKACERFAPENEAWEGPGPLATQIIEWLGGLLTPPASPEQASPSPVTGETRCDGCGGVNPVWFAPNEVWNLVVGGPDATDDPGGILCPICFIRKAETAGVRPTAWVLSPERITTDQSQTDRLPRLDEGLIYAAMCAHYGKDAGNIDGVDLTANGRNWTFREGFKRMWAGVRAELKRRAALSETRP